MSKLTKMLKFFFSLEREELVGTDERKNITLLIYNIYIATHINL